MTLIMKAPEFSSIETFVQFCYDDERKEYSHEELCALNFRTRLLIQKIRAELSKYGLLLATRPIEKHIRGFTTNSHDRWDGPGSCPSHGGSGFDNR
jgi:hypothetical protein